ncbi:MAG: hypothetical protein LBU56_03645 [Rickettsiales bacterium]|nr:hypothetical protein [Rickettsiales bacterium]
MLILSHLFEILNRFLERDTSCADVSEILYFAGVAQLVECQFVGRQFDPGRLSH